MSLGLRNHVKIYTNVSDAEKRSLLCASDSFISPSDSLQESFGLTPIEAMACGIPQVVSDWNGYRDTVAHGQTGFLVPTYWTDCGEELNGTGDLLGWEYDHVLLAQSLALDCAALYRYRLALIQNTDLRSKLAANSRACAIRRFSYQVAAERFDALFKELAQEAAEHRCPRSLPKFDQPADASVFGHYATECLTEGSVLE